jgi:hypothetical protein
MGGFVDDVSVATASTANSGGKADGWMFGTGWTVSTGSSKASGAAQPVPDWVLYVAVGVGVLYVLRRVKKGGG